MQLYAVILTDTIEYMDGMIDPDDYDDLDMDEMEQTVETDSIYGIFDSYQKAKVAEEAYHNDPKNQMFECENSIVEYQLNQIDND